MCLIFLCLLPLSYSARIDFKRIPTLHGLHWRPNRFFLNDPGVAKPATRDSRSVDLENVDDVLYVGNVTVGGNSYVLQVSIINDPQLVYIGASFTVPSLTVAHQMLSFPLLSRIPHIQYVFCSPIQLYRLRFKKN